MRTKTITTIAALVVILFVLPINARITDNTIVNDNSSWAILNVGVCPKCPVSTQYVYLEGDSIVADISYKKVFSCEDKLHENIKHEGLIREQDKKTFFIPANSETEYLLYDFSLEEGMEFELRNCWTEELYAFLEVKNIDLVEINGVLKKRMQINYRSSPYYEGSVFDTWIEGVGSLKGIFTSCYIGFTGVSRTLLCHHQNDELIYKNPVYSECYYNVPYQAKEYIPLLERENQWNELTENISLPPGYHYQKTYITKIGNDTIIDDVNYYKLLTARDETASIWLEDGYVREDIENRKVYYRTTDDFEILLYDFNAQVGEEIQSYDLQYSRRNVVITVKSIDYVWIGGKLRKQMNVHTAVLDVNYAREGNHVWIEGIGNMDGFLMSTMVHRAPGSDRILLLCFCQDNELIYKPENITVADCFVWKYPQDNSVQSIKNNHINIFPNPVDNIMTVSSLDNTISRVEIYDNLGRKVYSQTYKETIDVSSFSKGLYLLKAYSINEQVSVFKIVKK